ncbi:MAG: XRE family transcriptional regulator [Bacteroidetes bacterium]|nr:XRE family transcriptional regulator [Bacteroidota bacterium]
MNIKKTNFQLKVINTIKELRQNQNVTQALVSDILNLNSYGLIGNIESPKFPHKYTLKQINKLCKEFNYPIKFIFLSSNELTLEKDEIIECLIKKIIEYDG